MKKLEPEISAISQPGSLFGYKRTPCNWDCSSQATRPWGFPAKAILVYFSHFYPGDLPKLRDQPHVSRVSGQCVPVTSVTWKLSPQEDTSKNF